MPHRPAIRLKKGIAAAVARGLPWIYERQVPWTPALRALEPGTIVDLLGEEGAGIATAAIEPGSPIALRCWAREAGVAVDAELLHRRLRVALDLRTRLYEAPWYRLVHADADGLPGIVCDRFGEALAVRIGAVARPQREPLLQALSEVMDPTVVHLHCGGERSIVGPDGPKDVRVPEHGCQFPADLRGGQKTGWYYDQRPHRAFAARCAQGARVLDAFCYTGGFAVQAARAGARRVLALDRSQPALDLARQAATLNGVAERVTCVRADVFEELPALAERGERFDLLICDPPPLAPARGHRGAALQAHRHLARCAARLLSPGGLLIQASCSHAVAGDRFLKSLLKGLADTGRSGTLIHRGGAGPDHPLHPQLPQSAYLDVVGLRIS